MNPLQASINRNMSASFSKEPAVKVLHTKECATSSGAWRKEPTREPTQEQQLHAYEEIIQHGWETFLEVGEALARIRDEGLYKRDYPSFRAYCRRKWQFGKSQAYNLIGAAQVVKELSTIVDCPLPANEAQVRPLVGLRPELAKKAWIEAVQDSTQQNLTARLVKKKVAALNQKSLKAQKKRKRAARNQDSATALSRKLLETFTKIEHAIAAQKPAEALRLISESRKLLSSM